MARVAILMVNGFDRSGRYAAPLSEARAVDWLSLSVSQIARHTRAVDFEVLVYDNADWTEQRERLEAYPHVRVLGGDRELTHAEGLDFLASITPADTEVLVTLDTDAFPVDDEWLPRLLEKLDEGYAMVGVWRDEMLPVLQPFIHPSCLAMRREQFMAVEGISFAKNLDIDVGYNFNKYLWEKGAQLYGLNRSNRRNLHFLLGGIYGDIIYHQGAGSRFPRFWLPSDPIADERARELLQELAFSDLDRLVAYLRGAEDPELEQRAAGWMGASAQSMPSPERAGLSAGHDADLPLDPAEISYLYDTRLEPLFWEPTAEDVGSAWTGHVPFAHWLVGVAKPYVLVELGTRKGGSYLAFCRAVMRHGVDARCYAIDTWEGDPHSGAYGEEIFSGLKSIHDKNYGHFSKLLRMNFEAARPYFVDGSIDVLHIDGYHTYDAVRRDFVTWECKLSPRAVVLLHDTNERRDDFGVWRLWSELKDRYPAFEFVHSHGLGVLAVGPEAPKSVLALCAQASTEEGGILRARFAALGSFWTNLAGIRDSGHSDIQTATIRDLEADVESLRAQIRACAAERDLMDARLTAVSRARDEMLSSTSWRLSAPLRQIASALPSALRGRASRLFHGRGDIAEPGKSDHSRHSRHHSDG